MLSPPPLGTATDCSLSDFLCKARSGALQSPIGMSMWFGGGDGLRRVYLLLAMLFTALLCLSGIGVAAAEPQKNQIVVEASCSNGQEYTFVINGMSKTGDVEESTDNVVVKQYTVNYFQKRVLVGSDTFEFGNKKVLDGDLIQCSGVAEDIDVQGLGTVTAEYEFQAFVTPRDGA